MSDLDNSTRLEWLDIKSLTRYAAVSERTLRTWIKNVTDPLPASLIGTKILVSKTDFDGWLRRHRLISGASTTGIVDEIVGSLKER
jgi:hypothetical protein